MALTTSQRIHVLQIVLGGVGAICAFLGYNQAAGVVAIVVSTTGAVGAYLGGS